jgi:hypothetical protein
MHFVPPETNTPSAAPRRNRLARRLSVVCCAAIAVTGFAVPASASAPPLKTALSVRVFKNCTAMHRQYPHGVGRPGAVDKTSGTPDTKFFRSRPLYDANRRSDRDKDGIACEA